MLAGITKNLINIIAELTDWGAAVCFQKNAFDSSQNLNTENDVSLIDTRALLYFGQWKQLFSGIQL